MIQAARFAWAAVAGTWRWGGMAIRASRRGVPDTRGGVYDQAAFTRTFARLTGRTPAQFRRAHLDRRGA